MISYLLIETAQFPSFLLKNWPPWESKIFLGGFWHLFQLKFEEISPKIPRMQILRKLSPLAPLGIKNFFGRLLASISAQV